MKLFVRILPLEFRKQMASTYIENFNQLILVGEQVEIGLKEEWFAEPSSFGKMYSAKKEKEVAADVNVAYKQDTTNRVPTIQVNREQQQSAGR